LPSVSDGAMTTLVGELALPGALGSQSHVRRDTAAGHWRVMPPTATEKSCAQAVRAALKTPSRRPNGSHPPCRIS
jgi:hypothetical protein